MLKIITKVTTVLLVMSIILSTLSISSLSVFAADNTAGPEVILNDGSNAIGTVVLQHDCTNGQVIVSQATSIYGDAIALTTGDVDSHWNWYKSGIKLNKPADLDISSTTGFAFYVKIPVVEADTAIDVQWYISDANYWNEFEVGKNIYYVETGSTEITSEPFTWEEYSLPGHNKSGWDGFVFVPFDSLPKNYNGTDKDLITAAENFQIRVSIARENAELANQTFIFDEVGYYTDPLSYIAKAAGNNGLYDYIINDGMGATASVVVPEGVGATVSQLADERYGYAVGYTTGDSGWNSKVTAYLPVGEADLSKTAGIAFYAKVPNVTDADTAIDVMLAIDNNTYWNELIPGKSIYYLATGTDTVISEVFDWGNFTLPLHNRGGFEGFVFIPFDSMKNSHNNNYDGTGGRDLINAAEIIQFQFNVAKTDAPLANQSYVFDEIGFYYTPETYVAKAAAHLEGEIETAINENVTTNFDDLDACAYLPESLSTDNRVMISQDNSGASPYGSALKMTTGESGWNYGKMGVKINKRSNFDMSKATGVAFYAKVPDVGDLDTALDVWFWNTDRYTWNELIGGSMVYYLEAGTDNLTAVEFSWGNYSLPLHGKSGWEGFVFIPFSSMQCTWSDNEGKDRELINSMSSFELRFNVAKSANDAPGLANQEFIFDEFGFYTDPFDYVEHVEEMDSSNVVKGDANGDGVVNVFDLVRFKKILANTAEKTTYLGNYDLDRTAVIDSQDLVLLCKMILSK